MATASPFSRAPRNANSSCLRMAPTSVTSSRKGTLRNAAGTREFCAVSYATPAATVAYETAQNSRVPAAFRSVPFLDDVTEVGAIRKQLELALRGAREKGEAVAIGHPHPSTLQALREVLPSAQSEGVRLTFASELVH